MVRPRPGEATAAARKRAAVELIALHERALRQTARRYSLCPADAEDAFQRALEILLTKAPTVDSRDLIRWMQTVTKHEALAVRRNRERLLGTAPLPAVGEEEDVDWMALIPAPTDGPAERAERHELVIRSREALQTLKPAELKALTLLAEGYSYTEISELTGFSRTKVNRCLAEGRERFRAVLAGTESGSRCKELRSLISAFCDGETTPTETATLREHLRACAHCRSVMRAYRAAPRAAAALAPALPLSQSLFERLHDAIAGLPSRLGMESGLTDSAVTQVATAGGTRGAGLAGLTKLLAVCAGTAGSAACVAAGVVPGPLDLSAKAVRQPALERPAKRVLDLESEEVVAYEPAPEAASPPAQAEEPVRHHDTPVGPEASETTEVAAPVETGAVEYSPPAPAPEPAAASSSSASSSSGSAAGEFGP